MLSDLIVSLGPNCRNTWNLRNRYGFSRSYPFDWWITPASSMLKMLDPTFQFHVEMDDLIITRSEVGKQNSVYNKKLCMLHHHDFSRNDGNVVSINQQQIDNVNSKYKFLFERFHQDIEQAQKPVFVMNGLLNQQHVIPPEDDQIVPAPLPSANYILENLHKYFGDKCRLVVIDVYNGEHIKSDYYSVIRFTDNGHRYNMPSSQTYAEPVHVFEQAYDHVGLTLAPSSIQLAENNASDLAISNNQPKVIPTTQL